jgi:hypothetical protein
LQPSPHGSRQQQRARGALLTGRCATPHLPAGIINDGPDGHGAHFQRKMRQINESTIPDPHMSGD